MVRTTCCRNAMPGMLTGAIIGMARALGETAPLLMIGMVAFIVDVPRRRHRFGHGAAGADLPLGRQPGARFRRATSAAIMVLLVFLVIMNALAVILRNRFEKRW
jgi:phosphate transport system permease protein